MTDDDQYKDSRNVPCGTCPICIENRRQEWSFRLNEELKASKAGCFITLTLDDEICALKGQQTEHVEKRTIQLWLKRLRKELDHPIRYYIVSEYGPENYRPHYHGLLFNLAKHEREIANQTWGLGWTHFGDLNEDTIYYTTGYLAKPADFPEHLTSPFALMSRKPGIGHSYIERNHTFHEDGLHTHVIKRGGYKQALPRYYKEKFFTKNQLIDGQIKNSDKTERIYTENNNRLARLGNDPYKYREQQSDQTINQINRKYKKRKSI